MSINWTAEQTEDGIGVHNLTVGDFGVQVIERTGTDSGRHEWIVIAGTGDEQTGGSIVASGKSRMLNGAKATALLALVNAQALALEEAAKPKARGRKTA